MRIVEQGRREGAEEVMMQYRAYGFTSIETCLLHWEQVRLDELQGMDVSAKKEPMTRTRRALFREQRLYLEAQLVGARRMAEILSRKRAVSKE